MMEQGQRREFEVYASGLAEIRRKRRIFWILFFCFVAVLAWSFLGPYSISSTVGLRLGSAAIVWIAYAWVNSVRCPRCGQKFHGKTSFWKLNNRWPDQCAHCALELRQHTGCG